VTPSVVERLRAIERDLVCFYPRDATDIHIKAAALKNLASRLASAISDVEACARDAAKLGNAPHGLFDPSGPGTGAAERKCRDIASRLAPAPEGADA
jgi:hypothetical protein